ncbi:SGNH/GDSL hydrolase family protein [Arthrobacter sp. Soc17.1.1.1]|uniref:SGNH/GDSL hydrolase family protein n=1 Tax=Arthrobacter sp. Soc17.1.1.1 TaxID=3121277 RepID=UPI002FE4EF65
MLQANARLAETYTPTGISRDNGQTMPALPAGSQALFIGDSWAEGVGASDKADGNWAALTADYFGWERTIDGIGGTGFVRGGGSQEGAIGNDNNQYINRLNFWIEDPDMTPDLVVIEGGLNDDKAEPADLRAAVKDVATRAKEAWPDTSVLVMGPAAPQPLGAMLQRMAEPIRSGALDAGAFTIQPVLRGWFTEENSAQFLVPGDGAHVNDAGHQYTSQRLIAAIQELQN